MKVILFFLSVCLFETGFSQKNLDFGDVYGKSINGCNDPIKSKVTKSKTLLDIFFIDEIMLSGKSQSVSLSYDGFVWSAKKVENDWLLDKVDSFALLPVFSFDSIFSGLKSNRIFLLPDQKDIINIKGSVDDGHEYTISFRAGCKLRSYKFNNPDIYKKYNKDIPEFVNYVKITEIFFNWFKKK